MHYDSQIIYGRSESNERSFRLSPTNYYMTKSGICKKKTDNEKVIKISTDEYNKAWERYNFLFN